MILSADEAEFCQNPSPTAVPVDLAGFWLRQSCCHMTAALPIKKKLAVGIYSRALTPLHHCHLQLWSPPRARGLSPRSEEGLLSEASSSRAGSPDFAVATASSRGSASFPALRQCRETGAAALPNIGAWFLFSFWACGCPLKETITDVGFTAAAPIQIQSARPRPRQNRGSGVPARHQSPGR